MGSDVWISGSAAIGGVNVSHTGLWRQCYFNNTVGGVLCTVRGFPVEPWILAVRTLSVIALILAPIATGAVALNSFIPKLSGGVALWTAFTALLLQFCCFGAAMIIYTVNAYNRDLQAYFGWSYILGWVGVAVYGLTVAALVFQAGLFSSIIIHVRKKRMSMPSPLHENLLS